MRKGNKLPKKFQSMLLIAIPLASCYCGLSGCTFVAADAVSTVAAEVALSKSRAGILVTEDENTIKDCKLIKEVQAKSSFGGLLYQEKALEKTIADLTHESAEVGANVLLLKGKSKSIVGSHSEGVAYLCPTVDPAAEPTRDRLSDDPQAKSAI